MCLMFCTFCKKTTKCRAAYVERLQDEWCLFKHRLKHLHGHQRLSSPTMGIEGPHSPPLVTILSPINLLLHPRCLSNFIHDFPRRMDVKELSDIKWQGIDLRNYRLGDVQCVKCTQKTEIKRGSRDDKNEVMVFNTFTLVKGKVK